MNNKEKERAIKASIFAVNEMIQKRSIGMMLENGKIIKWNDVLEYLIEIFEELKEGE